MKKVLLLLTMALSFSYAQMAQEMTVYRTAYCGCCTKWIPKMEAQGLKVTSIVRDDFDDIKAKYGITAKTASCHTAIIGGYVIEGHVNYSAIKRLLTAQPKDIMGLTLPGMVVGSPGMEMGDRKIPYDILAIKIDGTTVVYESH